MREAEPVDVCEGRRDVGEQREDVLLDQAVGGLRRIAIRGTRAPSHRGILSDNEAQCLREARLLRSVPCS